VVTNSGSASFISKAAPVPATGPLVFVRPVKFVNAAAFSVGDRCAFKSTACCVNPPRFVNIGKFSVSKTYASSTGLVAMDGLVFENRGSVNLEAGKLRIGAGGYNQLSGETQLVGGNLEPRNLADILGGRLKCAGTITGDVRTPGSATIPPGARSSPIPQGSSRSWATTKQKGEDDDQRNLKGRTSSRDLQRGTPLWGSRTSSRGTAMAT
jgi:hypothetical protein